MSRLIVNESPLIVLRSLALAVGLNEAIFIQQLHYWLDISDFEYEGRVWIYKSLDEWCDEFPFWSKSTVRRVINSLKEKGLLIVKQIYRNRRLVNHYTIDYKNLSKLEEKNPPKRAKKKKVSSVQNEHVQSKPKEVSKLNIESVQNEASLTIYIQNTKKITKEKKEKVYKKKRWQELKENEQKLIKEKIKRVEESILPLEDFINSLEANGYRYIDFVKAYRVWVSREKRKIKEKEKIIDPTDPKIIPPLNNLPPKEAYRVEEW